MQSFIKPPANLLLLLLMVMLFGCTNPDHSVTDNTMVVLKFKAQPNKSDEALLELNTLLEMVREEPHFVSIKLHVDPKDKTNIMLYEEWDDAAYYNSEHMETAHIQEFMEKSRDFLMGPPDISFWEIQKLYH